jgi:hypothetical protein
LEDEEPKEELPGRRRFELPEKLEVMWLASSIMRDAFEGFRLTSSGGGEPEDGVETEGEPGSGGEFIVDSKFQRSTVKYYNHIRKIG